MSLPTRLLGDVAVVDHETHDTRDWGSTGFIPAPDELTGATDADNFRHTIVRTAFLDEIWKDEQVQALVSRWAQKRGWKSVHYGWQGLAIDSPSWQVWTVEGSWWTGTS